MFLVPVSLTSYGLHSSLHMISCHYAPIYFLSFIFKVSSNHVHRACKNLNTKLEPPEY